MKPLYLTYTNGAEPYFSMAEKLGEQVDDLDAGDFYHLCLREDGRKRNFFAETMALLYGWMSNAIDKQPVILLDADHELKKPITTIFHDNWEIAVAYRKPCEEESGRQDYCAGLVMLNNKRPNVIRHFWLEWAYQTIAWKQYAYNASVVRRLKDRGWDDSWFSDQASLNNIILPPLCPEETEIKPMQKYIIDDRRILPLSVSQYSAHPGTKGAFLWHYKGNRKL